MNEMDDGLIHHLNMCRCCLKYISDEQKSQTITKEIEKIFFKLTTIQVSLMNGFSAFIIV